MRRRALPGKGGLPGLEMPAGKYRSGGFIVSLLLLREGLRGTERVSTCPPHPHHSRHSAGSPSLRESRWARFTGEGLWLRETKGLAERLPWRWELRQLSAVRPWPVGGPPAAEVQGSPRWRLPPTTCWCLPLPGPPLLTCHLPPPLSSGSPSLRLTPRPSA